MFALTVPNLNLRHVYETCQDLSMKPIIGFERSGYLFFKGEDMCKVEQRGDRFLFSCEDDKFYDVWFDFFDLSTDYAELNGVARRSRSEISVAARSGSGVHLLRQDPWECALKEMLFMGVSPTVARQRLSDVMEATTEERGKTLKGYGYVRWRSLPTPEQLKAASALLDWFCDSETSGRCAAMAAWAERHRQLLDGSDTRPVDEVLAELTTLYGSAHVARRVAAYGFGFHDVDVTGARQARLIERQTGVDPETLIEFEFGEWGRKSSYVGTLLARLQALKNRM